MKTDPIFSTEIPGVKPAKRAYTRKTAAPAAGGQKKRPAMTDLKPLDEATTLPAGSEEGTLIIQPVEPGIVPWRIYFETVATLLELVAEPQRSRVVDYLIDNKKL